MQGSMPQMPQTSCARTPSVQTSREAAPRALTLPLTRAELASLQVGDAVTLSGPVYTARDAGHVRLLECLEATGELPFDLAGQTIFYAGPTPPAAARPIGAVGPTTAMRMDFAAPRLFEAGIVATIGKGARSQAVHDACVTTGSVCFVAVGGAAALLATHVVASELLAWDDLGTEALRKLQLKDFPAFVGIDVHGADIYDSVAAPAGTEVVS